MSVPSLAQILADTPAAAEPVNTNYATIANYIDDFCIQSDGSVGMNAQLHLVGNPVNPTDAPSKSYVDAVMPIGVMLPWAAMSIPPGGWLLCDGATKAIAAYPELSSRLGTRYNVGTVASGNFMLPNMRGRMIIGYDLADAVRHFDTLGHTGGDWDVPVPLHSHPMPHTHPVDHDHAAFNSSDNLSNHLHSIAHDHAVFNTAAPTAGHRHELELRQNSTPGTSSLAMAASAGTIDSSLTGNDDNTHVHQANVPSYVGNSGANSGNHTHSINVPPYTGASGAVSNVNTGDNTAALTHTGSTADEHLPPFIVLNYIIKALN